MVRWHSEYREEGRQQRGGRERGEPQRVNSEGRCRDKRIVISKVEEGVPLGLQQEPVSHNQT